MTDKVLALLALLGYSAEESDSMIIDALVLKVECDIKSYCNISYIPESLEQVVLFRTLGEFISAKKNSGQTGGFTGLNFEPVLSQLSEGDTSVSYYVRGMRSDERRLNLLVAALSGYGKSQLVRQRRILW